MTGYIVQLLRTFLGMDLDSDLQRTQSNRKALNIRSITDGGQAQIAYENILGNELAFTLPTVTVQNKIFRIKINCDVAATLILLIKDANGLVATTAPITITINDINTSLSSLQAEVTTAINNSGNTYAPLNPPVSSGNDGYLDIEIDTILGKNWFIVNDVSNTIDADIVTIQEAIDASIAGTQKLIGGYELLGDLHTYSTTQDNLSSQVDIVSSLDSGGQYLITTSIPHGIIDGSEISINDVDEFSGSEINGTWTVQVISTTTFILLGSVFIANGAGGTGTVTINTHGIGEIGVATYDANTGLSTYYTLIRSREFNFNTLKQIDCYHERSNVKISRYWTDDYNVPRVFYYKGDYVNNGAITEINPDGLYRYDTLNEETVLFVKNSDVQLNFPTQYQTGGGGGVLSGNWRYAVRFLTDSLTTTEATELTNPINVYVADFNGDASLIIGNAENVQTFKINELLITGIPRGIFKYVELIGVNYIGQSLSAQLIRRDVIANDADTQVIQHTGLEIPEPYDEGLLNFKNTAYNTAKNIDGIETELVLSNLTSPLELDFSEWARGIKYSLKQKIISTDGVYYSRTRGEYQDFTNVNNFVGYTHNETYRFGVRVKYKETGAWSSAFFIDDITFDTTIHNSAQQITALPNFNMTNGYTEIFVPYPEFTNFRPNFILSDGRLMRDVISAFRVVRADVIPEVLGCGMLHMATDSTPANTVETYQGYINTTANSSLLYGSGGFAIRRVLPSTSTNTFGLGNITARKYGVFYSPDILFGKTSVSFSSGMQIKVIGEPSYLGEGWFGTSTATAPVAMNLNESAEYLGEFLGTYNDFTLLDLKNVPRGGSATFINGVTYDLSPSYVNFMEDQRGVCIYSQADISGTIHSPLNRGIYYAQLFKKITNKYGTPALTKYVSTGQEAEITNLSSSTDKHDVFGGDTFTQRTYFHQRYPTIAADGTANFSGYGGGYGFISQNKGNTNMRFAQGTTNEFFPIVTGVNVGERIAKWLQEPTNERIAYNHGYNIRNDIQIHNSYDETVEQQTDLPTRFIYSDTKAQNSLVDAYRIFLPFNFRDANNSYGEVMHHANINGELMGWQRKAFSNMRYQPIAIISTEDGSEVITGTGAKMKQPQQVLSTYGTSNKWSVIKWLSNGGKDICGWVTSAKSIARYGGDGTVIISDRDKIKSFLANNLTFAQLYDTPAHGEGICAFYDQRFGDVGWTMRAHKQVPTWSAGSYSQGDEVFISGGTNFESTGDIYISLINNNTSNPLTSGTWEKVSHDNEKYWNEYTIVFNEIENNFKSFYSHKPKIYLGWLNSIVSPSPVADEKVYLHNRGDYCLWYDTQSEDAYVEMVFNSASKVSPEMVKRFLACDFDTEIRPYKIEFITKDFQTFTEPGNVNIENLLNTWYVPIQQDSTATGLNDGDESDLFGNFLIVRFYFEKLEYQKLVGASLKFNLTSRILTT